MKPQKNILLETLVNIVIPVIILNYLSKEINPKAALLIALSFPLGYGIYSYIQSRTKNIFSILGFFNILITGVLALITFEGVWFTVKETIIPFLLGIVVLATRSKEKPAFSWIFYSEYVFDIKVIKKKLEENLKLSHFKNHMKKCNDLFAVSFLLSTVLNFLLANRIFIQIPIDFSESQKQILLNEQIAEMQWKSPIVIMIPLMIFGSFTIWYFLSRLLKYINLGFSDLPELLVQSESK